MSSQDADQFDVEGHCTTGERVVEIEQIRVAGDVAQAYGEAFDVRLMQPVLDEAFVQHSLDARVDVRTLISKLATR